MVNGTFEKQLLINENTKTFLSLYKCYSWIIKALFTCTWFPVKLQSFSCNPATCLHYWWSESLTPAHSRENAPRNFVIMTYHVDMSSSRENYGKIIIAETGRSLLLYCKEKLWGKKLYIYFFVSWSSDVS